MNIYQKIIVGAVLVVHAASFLIIAYHFIYACISH
jgi:hypothetical protein